MSRRLDGGGSVAEVPALPVLERGWCRRLDGGGSVAEVPAVPVPERA
jgi:hypothetical protein